MTSERSFNNAPQIPNLPFLPLLNGNAANAAIPMIVHSPFDPFPMVPLHSNSQNPERVHVPSPFRSALEQNPHTEMTESYMAPWAPMPFTGYNNHNMPFAAHPTFPYPIDVVSPLNTAPDFPKNGVFMPTIEASDFSNCQVGLAQNATVHNRTRKRKRKDKRSRARGSETEDEDVEECKPAQKRFKRAIPTPNAYKGIEEALKRSNKDDWKKKLDQFKVYNRFCDFMEQMQSDNEEKGDEEEEEEEEEEQEEQEEEEQREEDD